MINFDKAMPEWRVRVRRPGDQSWIPLALLPSAAEEVVVLLAAEARLDPRWAEVEIQERHCTEWQAPEALVQR